MRPLQCECCTAWKLLDLPQAQHVKQLFSSTQHLVTDYGCSDSTGYANLTLPIGYDRLEEKTQERATSQQAYIMKLLQAGKV